MSGQEEIEDLKVAIITILGSEGGFEKSSYHSGSILKAVDKIAHLSEELVNRARVAGELESLVWLDDQHQTDSQDLEWENPGVTTPCYPASPVWGRIKELKARLSNIKREGGEDGQR